MCPQGCNNTLRLEGGISVHISPKNESAHAHCVAKSISVALF